MTHILLLVIGFALVLAGADSLVKGASSLAKRLRLSDWKAWFGVGSR